MRIESLSPGSTGRVKIVREENDPRPSNESHLLYQIKRELQKLGFDVIKKRMWKDGHMVSDHCQYIRSRNVKESNAFMIWDSEYAVRDLAEDYRKRGYVTLSLVPAIG